MSMEKEIKKRGRKGYIYHPSLGDIKNIGHKFPVSIHAFLGKQYMKPLLERMALDPDFKAKVLGMVDEL